MVCFVIGKNYPNPNPPAAPNQDATLAAHGLRSELEEAKAALHSTRASYEAALEYNEVGVGACVFACLCACLRAWAGGWVLDVCSHLLVHGTHMVRNSASHTLSYA